MSKQYFQLADDMYLPGRWDLGTVLQPDGEEVWPHLFRSGTFARMEGHLRVSVDGPGVPLDYSHAAYGIPIVHVRIASIFSELAPEEIQWIPVDVDSRPDQYLALNAMRLIKCIDDARCEEVQYWGHEDAVPEKVGTYFSVVGLRIDPDKVSGSKVFRTWGWTGALIVSEDIKVALERAKATGVKFTEV